MNLVLEVYLEKRASRVKVGSLRKEANSFVFEYDKKYIYLSNAIPIGPDIPLTKRIHKTKKLFPSFVDRIPSQQNPAYVEYCKKFNISENEKNEIILLATIGHKGPSSFVFELLNEREYSNFDYMNFRKELQLSLRDFSALFQISLSTLQKLEKMSSYGKEALKRIEIYDRFPAVAIFEAKKNKKWVHSDTYESIEKILEDKKAYIKTLHG